MYANFDLMYIAYSISKIYDRIIFFQFSGTFTKLWNITGTRIHIKSRGGEPWAEGSMIPGSNYSAQDDHGGLKVPGL